MQSIETIFLRKRSHKTKYLKASVMVTPTSPTKMSLPPSTMMHLLLALKPKPKQNKKQPSILSWILLVWNTYELSYHKKSCNILHQQRALLKPSPAVVARMWRREPVAERPLHSSGTQRPRLYHVSNVLFQPIIVKINFVLSNYEKSSWGQNFQLWGS